MSQCKFDKLSGTYYTSGFVDVLPGCYGFLFVNLGDTAVRVDNVFLKPYPPGRPDLVGASFAYSDDQQREYSRKQFQVIFDAAPGVDRMLEIHQIVKVF